jgi:hypothetical protein
MVYNTFKGVKMKNIWILVIIFILGCCSKHKEQPLDVITAEEKSIDTEISETYEEKSIDTVMSETFIDVGNNSKQEEVWTEEEMIQYYSSQNTHIKNETCKRITILFYVYTAEITSSPMIFGSGKDGEMIELLLDFLRKKENWSIDVENELPFIAWNEWNVSEDDMVRIYNWQFEGATGDTYHTIIQYKSESGTINSVYISGWEEQFVQFRERLGFGWGRGYGIGFKIEKQTYLIWAHARAGGFMSVASFLALRFLDGKIEPYPAFNGDNNLEFSVGTQYNGIIEDFNIQFNEKPFSFLIDYNPSESFNYDKPNEFLEFTFNGSEFMGDYNKFNKITNFRRGKN